jgi:high affinity sulfate transporter 1
MHRHVNDTATSAPLRGRLPLCVGLLPLDRATILRDVLAGVTLAAMIIPQVLGYTRIADMPVITGLYTLLLPLLAFALFGASRYLVVAADSATAAILAMGLVGMATPASPHYGELASFVALLTAAFLLLARLLRIGFLCDFLSRTVLVGFLTGVGIQVAIAVADEMLGLEVHAGSSVRQFAGIVRHAVHTHVPTLLVSCAVIGVIAGIRRMQPRMPGALIAIMGAIACSAWLDFGGHGIAVLGTVPGGLPIVRLPMVTFDEFRALLPVALSCFIMIVAQSAVTARAYAIRHHNPINDNADLLGLCAANAAAAFSGTFVVNGSPTQTAMVERAGGRSQVVHLTAALVVGVVLLWLTGPLRFLPQCVLGAIVFMVAVGLIDLRGLRDIRRCSNKEFTLALVTAAAVVVIGVEAGILLAIILSLLDHVQHSYRPHTAVLAEHDGHWQMQPATPGAMTEPGLIVYWFGNGLYYANAAYFCAQIECLLAHAPTPVRWLVVDAGALPEVDYTARGMLLELHKRLRDRGVTLAFAHLSASLREAFDHKGITPVVGADNLYETLRDCLAAYTRTAAIEH